MRYIAAPWRKAYVRTVHKMTGCVLCDALNIGDDDRAHILWRGRLCFVILNKYPYQPGHLMVAPYRHIADYAKAAKALSDEMADLSKHCLDVLAAAYHPQGFNVGMNLGRCAGAGVVDHVHLHIVPRWTGDSNFMPVVGGTKVVIEGLDATYARLKPLFSRRQRGRRPTARRTVPSPKR